MTRRAWSVAATVALAVAVPAAAHAGAADGATAATDAELTVTSHAVRVGRLSRTYRLAVPRGAPRGTRVLLVWHGGGTTQDGAAIAQQTGFDEVARRRGWAIAYPDGRGGHWNSGVCCSPRDERTNDVAFFDALLRDLARQGFRTDQVGSTGFSEGAFMTHRLACERGSRLALAVPAAGTQVLPVCRPTGPVPITMIWGGSDVRVPPRGSVIHQLPTPSSSQLQARWSRRNGCRSRTLESTPIARTTTATGCRRSTLTRTIVVRGLPHEWARRTTPGGFDATETVETLLAAAFARASTP